MTNIFNFGKVKMLKIAIVLSLPMAILSVSNSSLKVMGEGNSALDVLLVPVIYMGFVNLFLFLHFLFNWCNGKSE